LVPFVNREARVNDIRRLSWKKEEKRERGGNGKEEREKIGAFRFHSILSVRASLILHFSGVFQTALAA